MAAFMKTPTLKSMRNVFPILQRFQVVKFSAGISDENESPLELESNPFWKKYESKIKELQKSDPNEFTSRVSTQMERKKKKWYDETKPPQKPSLSEKPRQLLKGAGTSKVKTLDSVMKLELLQNLPAEEISKIWREFHKDKDRICAVIPAENFNKLYERAEQNPMFLYPLPRDSGYEFFFGQFDGQSFHFTSVINYQAYQEYAPILLSMVHFTDLQEKGIVLMSGEVSTDLLKVQDAQFLANQVQLFYLSGGEIQAELLRRFNHEPDKFKHMDAVKQLENKQFSIGGEES